MDSPSKSINPPAAAARLRRDNSVRGRLLGFAVFAVLLSLIFILPFKQWVQFAFAEERNSYLILIPCISAYLIWIKRAEIVPTFRSSSAFAIVPFLVGVALSVAAVFGRPQPDLLSVQILAFLSLLFAGALTFIGLPIIKQLLFPIAFLVFAIPVPEFAAAAIETFLQYTSAEMAYWMLSISQVPLLRDGLNFAMPGISIRVAQECSGYNSSFALFMVSALAGHLFLKSPIRKFTLTAAVIPLAIVRNGFRITTLSLLCVYDDPQWIHSNLHHRGGPIFFALSLVPFMMLLWWLRKREVRKGAQNNLKQ